MFMLNFAIVCGCVAAGLAQIIPDANKLNCRICEDANDLGDCKKIAVCDSSYEECFMDEVITAQLRIVYRAGCRAKDVCEGTNPGAGVGKRAEGEEVLACSRCCKRMNDTDGCNKRLCGIVDPLRDSQCYACSSGQSETIQGDVTNPEDCVSFKTCQHNEACYARTHVSGGKVSFEYGCHQLAICEVLMQRMIVDKQACESSGNVDNCGTESLYCFTCCAWGACNYGDCKAQNKQIYDLYKKNLFDLTTLKKITSNSTTTTAPVTPAPTTPAPAPTTPAPASTTPAPAPTTPAPAPTTPAPAPTTPAPASTMPPAPASTMPSSATPGAAGVTVAGGSQSTAASG